MNITVHPRISISSDNKQLTLRNVNRTDSHHKYRCLANNSLELIRSDAALLNVECEYDGMIRYSHIIHQVFHPLSCFDSDITRSTLFPHSYNLTSAPPRSAQQEQKPLGLFWRIRPSTSNYSDTLCYNL